MFNLNLIRVKYIIYTAILLVGIVAGKFIFGSSPKKADKHEYHKKNFPDAQMWTCSMHPHIIKQEPGSCPICGMSLIIAQAGKNDLTVNQFKMTKNALALADIQTTVVGKIHKIKPGVVVSGKIVENEENNSVQASYFSGRIENLAISFTGEKVKKGQLLATIYAPDLIKAQQELLTVGALKKTYPNLYKSVRNKLKLWKLSESQISQIENSKKIKEYFPVYANVSGTVIEKLVEIGDYVSQGQVIFKIANLNSVWASFDVYETQITSFNLGQEIQISLNAYPGETFTAKISFIGPVVNPQTRVLNIRAVLPNYSDKFKPGMFVYGEVYSRFKDKNNKILIPASAVLWTGKRSIVYVKLKADEPVFELREVLLGNRLGAYYEIKKGVNTGDEIVSNGVFTVDASAQLQGKKSMMNHTKSINYWYNNVPETFKEQLQLTYNSYIEIKNAFVKIDTNKVKEHAKYFNASLKRLSSKLLSNEQTRKQWIILAKLLSTSSEAIFNDITIEKQRKQFKILSNSLILAVELFGIKEASNKFFCPMADNDKGAYWLSKEKQILNPYLSDKMLKCGVLKQVINRK
ncbi:MAG: efflux RND transporter periplasmic adaptor subunit [Tenacibaculum sp.]